MWEEMRGFHPEQGPWKGSEDPSLAGKLAKASRYGKDSRIKRILRFFCCRAGTAKIVLVAMLKPPR